MLHGKLYVVTAPELVQSVARNSRVLAFNPFIAQIGKRMTGHDDATSAIVQHNLNGEDGPGYVTEIHDGTVATLSNPGHIGSITCAMLKGFEVELDDIKLKPCIHLFAWLRDTITRTSSTAIYGPENPLACDGNDLVEAFWFVPWAATAMHSSNRR